MSNVIWGFPSPSQTVIPDQPQVKKYVALLSDSEVIVLENTLGQDLTFIVNNVGIYGFTSPISLFPKTKTFCTASFTGDVSIVYAQIGPFYGDDTTVWLYTYDSSGTLTNIYTNRLDVMIEIRVYP